MLTKDEAKAIAADYLDKYHDEFEVLAIYDKPYSTRLEYGYNPEQYGEIFFVCCCYKELISLFSSMCLRISKKDGRIISFYTACDEG